MKKVLVLGGDGFCGWPTALHLSMHGYAVTIVDNLSRRNIDNELEVQSLTPIVSMGKRISTWMEISGKSIGFINLDVANEYKELSDLILEIKPDAIVHFAEQRAAPYSMKSPKHKIYTVNNNINATNNVLAAIVEHNLDIHLVHLGTMGVYGYGTVNQVIPEGYLPVFIKNRNDELEEVEIMYPAAPGSIYHTTKTMDALLFHFYNKNDKIKITDLHQGIVWGTNTAETNMHPDLVNRFDYDGDYGTVLNRFLIQAAVGHPLTVHGTGGQTRAFIHIRNTVECIKLAIENPPSKEEKVKVFNQVTETHTIKDLAELVSESTGAEIRFYDNPRNEADKNELEVSNDMFLGLGLNPITLKDGLLTEILDVARKHEGRVDQSHIIAKSLWSKEHEVDEIGKADEPK